MVWARVELTQTEPHGLRGVAFLHGVSNASLCFWLGVRITQVDGARSALWRLRLACFRYSAWICCLEALDGVGALVGALKVGIRGGGRLLRAGACVLVSCARGTAGVLGVFLCCGYPS